MKLSHSVGFPILDDQTNQDIEIMELLVEPSKELFNKDKLSLYFQSKSFKVGMNMTKLDAMFLKSILDAFINERQNNEPRT